MRENYYITKLYPIQDGILKVVRDLEIPFYLTGGTALSRYYNSYRYSDDIDLFVNDDDKYSGYIQKFYAELEKMKKGQTIRYETQDIRRYKDFTQFIITRCDTETILKIDLVNDIAPHYGKFGHDETLGKIDSLRNILSNKISALYRYEAKDIVDLVFISRRMKYDWKELAAEAREKDASIDPLVICEILNSFPAKLLDEIKWIEKINYEEFTGDLKIISEDLFTGGINRLCSVKC